MFYNKYFVNGYEELLTYYPRYYRNIFEMNAILRTCGELADNLETNIEGIFNNCFIDTSDVKAVSRLEQFLGLEIDNNRDIIKRRNLLKAFFVGSGKISATKIKQTITSIIGIEATIDVSFSQKSGLIIEINSISVEIRTRKEISFLITKMIPAHLARKIIYQKPLAGQIYFCGIMCAADITTLRQVE